MKDYSEGVGEPGKKRLVAPLPHATLLRLWRVAAFELHDTIIQHATHQPPGSCGTSSSMMGGGVSLPVTASRSRSSGPSYDSSQAQGVSP